MDSSRHCEGVRVPMLHVLIVVTVTRPQPPALLLSLVLLIGTYSVQRDPKRLKTMSRKNRKGIPDLSEKPPGKSV